MCVECAGEDKDDISSCFNTLCIVGSIELLRKELRG